MKLPSLRSIERVVKMVPVVKDLLPNNESEYYDKIRKLEDALHDKKAEIFTLRQKILELEDAYENQTWMLSKKQEELDEALR